MVHFKEITKENLWAIVKLKVFEHQEDQVATNLISIAQGNYEDNAWFRGIYDDEVPVGFVMLALEPEKNEFDVWRFMIDKNHQGKGYGKAALNLVKKVVKEQFPEAKELGLSYVPKEKDGADGFYKKLGFEDTGEMEGKEKVMRYVY